MSRALNSLIAGAMLSAAVLDTPFDWTPRAGIRSNRKSVKDRSKAKAARKARKAHRK